ncbi:hypothetical protein ASPSYDRAFT_26018 [Aspergillus sydowii CBS 593.65]|uniref:RING-type domain-containing protein n=1 Tax=Aspergillus sydowii CBS 593.65 TaxID=1036612 RepID=A0A1L9TX07_9EURO|nr:uncharacterized protein ASPSYDRAFT_26018 [Aspergillus sydowii CBS 593.65]OJJ63984.1 hypothetical protein ASPSYDRAFT_26018 [Aspergillus sydowii CBS 593.65]
MVSITIEGLRTEGKEEPESATLDVPAETELDSLPSLAPGYLRPDSFTRIRQNGTESVAWKLRHIYCLDHPTENVEVSADRPSNFSKRCINVDDTLLHFVNLEKGSQALTAKLNGEGLGQSSSIVIDGQLEIAFHRTLRMPDDAKTHPLPASRGTFPLYNVDAFASRLPERITQHGGIFFPMWQREALWFRFQNNSETTRYAIRVNIGHINAISGLDIFEAAGKQDYIVVPGQKWLDGVAVSPGVVRQFVAMPLGSGYTVEGQVSGKETFGGIQIEVIPSYECNSYTFKHRDGQDKHVDIAENSTPRSRGLKNGDMIKMTPEPSTFRGLARICDLLDDGESLDGIQKLHLMAGYLSPSGLGGSARSSRRRRLVEPWRYLSNQGALYPRSYRSTRSEVRRDSNPTHAHNPERPQEMGIAAGGKLVQDIVRDKSPNYIWNKARAKLVHIHILHPSFFEAVTHFLAPKTPISTQEYLAAGIPFFAVEEDPDQRLDGSEVLAGVKSVSAMDSHVGVQDGSSTDFDPLKPKRCTKCAVRLCDCIVRPCNHQFCHLCIKAIALPGANTGSGHEQCCPLCSANITRVAGFSAPMNLPGEETFKVDVPVVMLEVEDGRTAFQSVMEMRL